MKKFIGLLFLLSFTAINCFSQSQNVSITIEVTNLTVNGGKVYLVLFSNADSFRREQPDFAFELNDNSAVAVQTVSVPPGDYVISAFQDANNNQKLDYGLFGIPKELVGISNYNGQGFPSKNFDRQKIPLNSTTGRVSIRLYRF
ncbi:MAG: DUF2141 domain-containing protein [Treponema sp.]|jgi:uncharacterized protein (DUF2141 family)|nr:DUF2141 domain-containing protein [Treponema sp.]